MILFSRADQVDERKEKKLVVAKEGCFKAHSCNRPPPSSPVLAQPKKERWHTYIRAEVVKVFFLQNSASNVESVLLCLKIYLKKKKRRN